MAKVFKGIIFPLLKPFAWLIVQCILGKLVSFAQETIIVLNSGGLSGAEKQKLAKEKIKAYASEMGIAIRDLAVNLGIELLVALVGNKKK